MSQIPCPMYPAIQCHCPYGFCVRLAEQYQRAVPEHIANWIAARSAPLAADLPPATATGAP